MDNRPANQLIPELLKELQSLVKELKNNSTSTSQLELDLMKEKIRVIYDVLCDVKIQEASMPYEEDETATIPVIEEEPIPEKEQKPETVPEPVLDMEEEVEIEVEKSATSNIKEEDQPPPSSEPILNLFEEPLTVTDDNDTKSVGEKIAEEKPVESIGEVIQNKKTVNLKLAIGINEKFFFLNELFEGKMNEYNEAIEKLDQEETYKDAIEQLELMKTDKNWDEEAEAYVQLKGFLERKFN